MRAQKLKPVILSLISNFLDDKDNEKFLNELNKIGEANKTIWFKFFKGDTLATTIQDLNRDLKYYHMPNYKYMVECFEIAKQNNSLEIHFS